MKGIPMLGNQEKNKNGGETNKQSSSTPSNNGESSTNISVDNIKKVSEPFSEEVDVSTTIDKLVKEIDEIKKGVDNAIEKVNVSYSDYKKDYKKDSNNVQEIYNSYVNMLHKDILDPVKKSVRYLKEGGDDYDLSYYGKIVDLSEKNRNNTHNKANEIWTEKEQKQVLSLDFFRAHGSRCWRKNEKGDDYFPVPPEKLRSVMKFWVIIFFYLLGETLLNGLFYSEGTEGLIAGWGVAFGVALFIIIGGFGCGFCASHAQELTATTRSTKGDSSLLEKGIDSMISKGLGIALIISLICVGGIFFYYFSETLIEKYSQQGTIVAVAIIVGLVGMAFALTKNDAKSKVDEEIALEHGYRKKSSWERFVLRLISVFLGFISLLVVVIAGLYRDELVLNELDIDEVGGVTIAVMENVKMRLLSFDFWPKQGLLTMMVVVVNFGGFVLSRNEGYLWGKHGVHKRYYDDFNKYEKIWNIAKDANKRKFGEYHGKLQESFRKISFMHDDLCSTAGNNSRAKEIGQRVLELHDDDNTGASKVANSDFDNNKIKKYGDPSGLVSMTTMMAQINRNVDQFYEDIDCDWAKIKDWRIKTNKALSKGLNK